MNCDNTLSELSRSTAVFNHMLDIDHLRAVCNTLQGELPIAYSQEDYENKYVAAQAAFSAGLHGTTRSKKCRNGFGKLHINSIVEFMIYCTLSVITYQSPTRRLFHR